MHKKASRTKNAKRNMIFSIANSVFSIVAMFLIRTMLLRHLGEEYVGLSSLLDSVLKVLNMAELGFSGAIVYSMYKPLAEGDNDTVCALLNFYRKIYCAIGSIIFFAGLMITPAIPRLIKGGWPNEINIYVLYFLYLANTAVSYFFFAHKTALLNAIQRVDIVKLIHLTVQGVSYTAQIIVLIALKNYYVFVILSIFSSIAINVSAELVTRKLFPEYVCKGEISRDIKSAIKKQAGGLMTLQICETTRNSLDSVVLSATIGLAAVAVYNNYYFIYNGVCIVLSVLVRAVLPSVGNSIACESKEKNYGDTIKLQFIFSWVICMATTMMLVLYQPVMKLWAGEKLMLNNSDMILFCVYFFVFNMKMISELYFTACGLWWDAKWFYFLESFGNLFLNIVLGKYFGITGILLATIITTFFFSFFARNQIVFKKYFERSAVEFYVYHAKFLAVTLASCGICVALLNMLTAHNAFAEIIIRGFVGLIVSVLVPLLCFGKTKEFENAVRFVKSILKV